MEVHLKEKTMSKKIDEMITGHADLSYEAIADIVGIKPDAVRKRYRKLGLPPKKVNSQNRPLTPEKEIERDVAVQSLTRKVKGTDAKYKLIQEHNATLRSQLEVLKVVGEKNYYTIPEKKSGEKNVVTAVAVASDWHIGETVHSDHINGMNEYNPAIAKKRIDKFFQNVVRLCQMFGKESKIDNLVLALLGDFINNQLREEAMENNSMLPMEEVIESWRLITAGIEYILENTDLNLIIPCHSGNHARVTRKVHWSTEAGNSLEYPMYHAISKEFAGNKRVQFIIPKSYHSYVDVAGFVIRFHHGHAIKYSGGIGGLFIGAYKGISQWQKARHADLDVFGHYHQSKDGGNFLCNGSLIGFNEYAVAIKADYEKPKQTFFLIDHKRKEKTVTTPIFLE